MQAETIVLRKTQRRVIGEIRSVGGGGGGLASARINSVRERGIYSEPRHETRFSRGGEFFPLKLQMHLDGLSHLFLATKQSSYHRTRSRAECIVAGNQWRRRQNRTRLAYGPALINKVSRLTGN